MAVSDALPAVTSFLQALLPLSLFTLSGVALCLEIWVIPLILLPSNTSRSKIHQFNETVGRGGAYLQPTSRALAVLLVAVTVLTSYYGDAAVAATWKYYLAAGVILVQTAWFEVEFIFPINDEIKAMESDFESPKDSMLPEKDRKHLDELAGTWRQYQWGRIIIPFVSGCVTLAAIM